jgi:hypothetical protein
MTCVTLTACDHELHSSQKKTILDNHYVHKLLNTFLGVSHMTYSTTTHIKMVGKTIILAALEYMPHPHN